MATIKKTIEVHGSEKLSAIFGELDANIKLIREEMGVDVRLREGAIELEGESSLVEMTSSLIDAMENVIEKQGFVSLPEVRYLISVTKEAKSDQVETMLNDVIVTTSYGKPLRPKTLGQKRYVDAIRDNGFTFGIGPAGTGKTYLAMAMAVKAFKNREVNRIILTRPAVEAGENLGFLPGDLQEKIDPYLRPLYDALFEILGHETYLKLMERGQIEVAPLAYMRGRTLDNSFIVLDEAQNTTNEQMKMFLTRLGNGSKAVITGDITQVDLPRGRNSGLITIQHILKNVEGVSFCNFDKGDVVRHPLVQRIIDAYERNDREEEQRLEEKRREHAEILKRKNQKAEADQQHREEVERRQSEHEKRQQRYRGYGSGKENFSEE